MGGGFEVASGGLSRRALCSWYLLVVGLSHGVLSHSQEEHIKQQPAQLRQQQQELVYDEEFTADHGKEELAAAAGCKVGLGGKICSGPKHGHCGKNLQGEPTCHCHRGWGKHDCSHADCPEDKKGVLCHGNGKCLKRGYHRYKCVCKSGWKGKDCEVKDMCVGMDGPYKAECSGPSHGHCGLSRYGHKQCHCKRGWGRRHGKKNDCSRPLCPINVADVDKKAGKKKTLCSSHGKCKKAAFHHHHCKCDKFWCGKDCHISCLCDPGCGQHGKCSLVKKGDKKGPHKCVCEKGFTGATCQDRGCPKCGAAKKTCSGNGLCTLCPKSSYNKKTFKCKFPAKAGQPTHFPIIHDKKKKHHRRHRRHRRWHGFHHHHKHKMKKLDDAISMCHCDPGWTGECCDIPTCPLGCAPSDATIRAKSKGKECWEPCENKKGEKNKQKGFVPLAPFVDKNTADTKKRAEHSGCPSGFCGKFGTCCRKGIIHPGGFPYGACDGNHGSERRHVCTLIRRPCGWHVDHETGIGMAHGQCKKSGKGYKCKCAKGWTGPSCCIRMTFSPTKAPTLKPTTGKPTAKPTSKPSAKPTKKPTATPSVKPTKKPTGVPTKVDPCSKMHCGPNAKCVEGPPPHCECNTITPSGECIVEHWGPKCKPCPDCGAFGDCNEGVKSDGKCKCHHGYEGALCNKCQKGYHRCANSNICTQKHCPGELCGNYTHMDDRFNNWECVGLNCEFHCRADQFGTCTNCFGGNCKCGKAPFEKDMAKAVLAEKFGYPHCFECPVGTFGRKCQKCKVKCAHGKCSSGKFGTGKCDCHDGYTGPTCSSCVTGYFKCKDKTGKTTCRGLKCTGSACGDNTFEKADKLDWQCDSGWCNMKCTKSLLQPCKNCHGGTCKCKDKPTTGIVSAP